jgi:hypothetical protein
MKTEMTCQLAATPFCNLTADDRREEPVRFFLAGRDVQTNCINGVWP